MKTLIKIVVLFICLLPAAAQAQGSKEAVELYRIAYTEALAGHTDTAFVYLHRSVDAGFEAYDHILNDDPDLVSLRRDPRWNDVVQKLEAKKAALAKRMAELPNAVQPFSDIDSVGYLEALLRLETMKQKYADAPSSWTSLLSEVLGWTYALVGDDRGAASAFERNRSVPEGKLPAAFDSYTPRPARQTILQLARKTSIVIINEGHHVPMHRVLTRELLRDLYINGYRYFAVEAVGSNEKSGARGFPKVVSSYTADPVFADLLRTAVELGYQVISYDTFAVGCVPSYCFTARDSLAARKLHAQTFGNDPKAKVLAHVGYSHAVERSPYSKPLAFWLHELTGHDPLTVDQTQMVERNDTTTEDPEYRRAFANGWLTEPIVIQKPDGSFHRSTTSGFGEVDMQVYAPRSKRIFGRPQWLERLGRTIVDIRGRVPTSGGPYLVQAFSKGLNPNEDVPFDQVLVRGDEPVGLALGKGKYSIVVRNRAGIVARSTVESYRLN